MKNFYALAITALIFFTNTALVSAEDFSWPSDGYIGWKFYTNTNGQEGISGTYHTGVDIWSNQDGGWNGGVYGASNTVRSTYSGNVIFRNISGVIIQHSQSLFTKFWHVINVAVYTNQYVDANTLLGYQEYANAVHVHFTVANQWVGTDSNGAIDPSPYFGVQLSELNPNVVPWGYYVCGGGFVTIQKNIYENGSCIAKNQITINPDSVIQASNFVIEVK